MSGRWDEVEPILRHRAYATIENDPQVLLETDGGPASVKADLIYARLIGLEDEIVEDGLRLARPEPVIRLPIHQSTRLWRPEDDAPSLVIRIASYVMQSGFAVAPVAAEYAPPGVEIGPDFTFRVLYLRYRRRDRP